MDWSRIQGDAWIAVGFELRIAGWSVDELPDAGPHGEKLAAGYEGRTWSYPIPPLDLLEQLAGIEASLEAFSEIWRCKAPPHRDTVAGVSLYMCLRGGEVVVRYGTAAMRWVRYPAVPERHHVYRVLTDDPIAADAIANTVAEYVVSVAAPSCYIPNLDGMKICYMPDGRYYIVHRNFVWGPLDLLVPGTTARLDVAEKDGKTLYVLTISRGGRERVYVSERLEELADMAIYEPYFTTSKVDILDGWLRTQLLNR